jgi:two-component system, NarL family, response regulator NreC
MTPHDTALADPLPLEQCVNDDRIQTDREQYERLTDRERSVLRMVGQGYSAPEIGARLSISPKTVDTYKQRIHEKLEITHRSQYVQLAFRLGLLAED